MYKKLISDSVLMHYGILGMKWGVIRKDPSKSSSQSSDSKEASALRGKKVSSLSNSELRTLNTRLQLEQQYKDLTRKDISPGKKFVGEVLRDSGKNLASQYVTGFAKNTIRNISYAINPDLIPN